MQPYSRSPDLVWPGHLHGAGCLSARAVGTGFPTVGLRFRLGPGCGWSWVLFTPARCGWGLGWVCLGSVCGVVPLLPAVCGVRGWALVSAHFRDVCGFVRVSLAPRRLRFRCFVWACLLGLGLGCAPPFLAGLSGCVFCAFFFPVAWCPCPGPCGLSPRLISFRLGCWLFFFFLLLGVCLFRCPFSWWAAVPGLVLPVLAGWSPCARLGVLPSVPSGWGVWPPSVLLAVGLVAVGCFRTAPLSPAPPPFFGGGGGGLAVPPFAFPRLALALWLVCGVVGPSPLLAEVPVCYSPPLLAGFRCRLWWAVPATPGWGPLGAVVCGVWCVAVVCWWGCGWCVVWLVPRHSWRMFLCATPRHSSLGFAAAGGGRSPPLLAGVRWRRCCVVCGVWRWCVVGVVAGLWCGWSLATPGGGSCVLHPATPGWVSLPVVVGGPRHSWLGSACGGGVWCVVCGVWRVVVVCWWGCGWCVVWLVPRHSWRRFLCATPRHSWLGFAAAGGGRSPPLLAGVRWRRWCVVCGVWRWCVVGVVVGVWCVAVVCCWGCGWCVVWLVPRHSWRRSLCATPRHSWLGFAAGGGGPSPPLLAGVRWRRWCVVCGVWCVVCCWGPSPLLAEVPVCYSPPLLAGFRSRWWWAVPATPGWGPLAAVLCGVWCVVCCWGCGWCVVWLVPRHSWRRSLCATPRHSWLGFAAGGGGRSPPLLAGVRWRRWCVLCGVLVGSLATPGGGSRVLLPATPGWVSLPLVVGGPRHSWLGSAGGGGVWCVVCGGGVLVGLWLGQVGRAGLLGAFWCASPSPLADLSFCFAWPPPGWGCPSLFRFCCRSSLVVLLGLPLPGSPCARASFVSPAWPLAALRWLLPRPPPLLCLPVVVAPAWCLGGFFFFGFFFPSSSSSVRPCGLWLSLVSGPGRPGPRRLHCLLCWPSASPLSVRLSLFRAFRPAVGCSRVVAAPPPPLCVSRFSFLPLGAVCRVVLCVPGCGAAPRCCALCRPVLCCRVLCCARLVPLLVAPCPLALPVALGPCALRCCVLRCSPALCALCCVCFVVARWCVLLFAALPCAVCVSGCCAVRSLCSPFCAVLCFAVLLRSRCAVREVRAIAGAWCCGVLLCVVLFPVVCRGAVLGPPARGCLLVACFGVGVPVWPRGLIPCGWCGLLWCPAFLYRVLWCCAPPPPPLLCLAVFVAPAWCLGVFFFFLFFSLMG